MTNLHKFMVCLRDEVDGLGQNSKYPAVDYAEEAIYIYARGLGIGEETRKFALLLLRDMAKV